MIAIDTLDQLAALHPIGSFGLNRTYYTFEGGDNVPAWDCVLHFYGEVAIGYGETPEAAISQAIVKREDILVTKAAPITADILA